MNKYIWISLDYDDDTTYSKGMKSQGLLFHCLFVEHQFFEKTWSFLFSLLLINGCLKADPFVPQHLGSSLRGGVIAR